MNDKLKEKALDAGFGFLAFIVFLLGAHYLLGANFYQIVQLLI